jgi:hypothetical protein
VIAADPGGICTPSESVDATLLAGATLLEVLVRAAIEYEPALCADDLKCAGDAFVRHVPTGGLWAERSPLSGVVAQQAQSVAGSRQGIQFGTAAARQRRSLGNSGRPGRAPGTIERELRDPTSAAALRFIACRMPGMRVPFRPPFDPLLLLARHRRRRAMYAIALCSMRPSRPAA